MGEGTYVVGMVKENFIQELTFTMKHKGWQGLFCAESQRKSISSRRNINGKNLKMLEMFEKKKRWPE